MTEQAEVGSERLPERVFNRLVEAVVSPVVDAVDVDHVVEQIDVNNVVGRVDLDGLLEDLDLNAVLDGVDVDRLLDRIDIDSVLDRVDINRVLNRVDVDSLLRRVDVNAVVEQSELGVIIARSTTGVFSELLDVARTHVMALDQFVQGVPARLIRGVKKEIPEDPSGKAGTVRDTEARLLTSEERAVMLQRRYSGSVSRFLAFIVDQFVMGVLFALGSVLTAAAIQVVIGTDIQLDEERLAVIVAYWFWAFVYLAGSLAATGRTIGKAMLGLLVVNDDGRTVDVRGAVLRTIFFPLSFILFGVGLLIGLVRRDRRELHDLIAGTAVIYRWDAASAERRLQSR